MQMGLLVRRGQAYVQAGIKMSANEQATDQQMFASAIAEIKTVRAVLIRGFESIAPKAVAAPTDDNDSETDDDDDDTKLAQRAVLQVPEFDVNGTLTVHVNASTPITDKAFAFGIRTARVALHQLDRFGAKADAASRRAAIGWWDIDCSRTESVRDSDDGDDDTVPNWTAVPGKESTNKPRIEWLRPVPTLAKLHAALACANQQVAKNTR